MGKHNIKVTFTRRKTKPYFPVNLCCWEFQTFCIFFLWFLAGPRDRRLQHNLLSTCLCKSLWYSLLLVQSKKKKAPIGASCPTFPGLPEPKQEQKLSLLMSILKDRPTQRIHRTLSTGKVSTMGRIPGKRLHFRINWEKGDLPWVMWKLLKCSSHFRVGGLPSAKWLNFFS